MPIKPPKRPPAEPDAFDEAVRWFRERVLMTDEEFLALEGASHQTAFTIAGTAQLDLVTEVWERADAAVAQGESLESFQEAVGDKLAAAWGQDMPWRVETIYRTNVQRAYAAGRYEQMTHPAVKSARPYWRFSAVMDSRTTEVCQQCDGVVIAADDPWWRGHYAPLHFNCRSHAVTLSEEEAQAEGITRSPPTAQAMEGFGQPPSVPGDVEPDLVEYPAALGEAYSSEE
jgi:SPP1 gp7 family putative phage head morphogenesis protein